MAGVKYQSIRFPHNRYQVSGSDFGPVGYRGTLQEARNLALTFETRTWGQGGMSYGSMRIYDRVEKTYLPIG